MTKGKKYLLAAVAVAAAAVVLAAVYFAARPGVNPGEKEFTLEIVHGDSSARTLRLQTDQDYLGAVLLEEGIIQGDQGEFGLYITAVDGEEAVYERDGAYWALFVNGDYATQGVDATPIADGDSFSLVYTTDG